MTKTRLRNRFLKNVSGENRELFCKQRDLPVPLLRKSEKDYFAKLNEKKLQIRDNSGRWISPFRQKRLNHQTESISFKKTIL